MLFTAPLLSKSSFFGSLVNKCRPAAAANFSVASSNPAPVRTIEEKLGLPPRPKKPLTPYFRFLCEERPKILAENPKISTIDVVRLISKRWGDADAVLKKRLQDEYKREQQKYVEIRAKYEAKMTDEQRAEMKHLKQDIQDAKDRRMMRKRIKELGRPKRPSSAFLRFLIQERANSPQTVKQTYREWHQKCTEKWARLSNIEKEVYLVESRKDMEAYKKDIAEWEEKMVRLGNIDVVRHGNLIDPPEPKSKGLKTSA